MKNLFSTKLLLLISLFAFTSCSNDEAVKPAPNSFESLSATKWNWISWGATTGDEIKIDPAKPVSIHFIDAKNIERISTDENGQIIVTQLSCQINKDTLIAYEATEANYFLIKEHTDTKLTLSRVKHINLETQEEYTTSASIFKYNKAAN